MTSTEAPQSRSSHFERRWFNRLAPAMLFTLEGKVAVVTGAAGGIGSWLSAGLAQAGASVLLTDRDLGPTQSVADELCAHGLKAAAFAADLAEDDAPQSIVNAARERFGRLDVLINNAGVNKRMPILEVDRKTMEELWVVDYRSVFELSQAAARVMIAQGGGSIINISSLNNVVGLEDVSIIGPAKAALTQLTKVMTVEWSRYGIRANALAPGFMDTPMNATHWTDPTRAPWIMDRTPMCRPGHPAELVGLCLLFASDAGSFISGQIMYVDGGFLAGIRWNVPPGAGLAEFLASRGRDPSDRIA
jgi:NAD(P)-dependent dehydrogenase (short-subunit alcohol dehydrogenase family)